MKGIYTIERFFKTLGYTAKVKVNSRLKEFSIELDSERCVIVTVPSINNINTIANQIIQDKKGISTYLKGEDAFSTWEDDLGMLPNPFKSLGCNVTISPSKKAKKLSIKVIDSITLEIVIPLQYPIKEVEEFIINSVDEISNIIKKLKIKESNGGQAATHKFYPGSEYKTPYFNIQFFASDTTSLSGRMDGNTLYIVHPRNIDPDENTFQSYIVKCITEGLRISAKRHIAPRVTELAAIHNFDVTRVSIRDSKSRWGSCSSKKCISISLYLAKLPIELQEFVILHELCHTVEMNHSARFYNLLSEVACNGDDNRRIELEQKLKMYSTNIYL